jgi:hypothetical protein
MNTPGPASIENKGAQKMKDSSVGARGNCSSILSSASDPQIQAKRVEKMGRGQHQHNKCGLIPPFGGQNRLM